MLHLFEMNRVSVATIRQGDNELFHVKCPNCGRFNSSELWDRTTTEMFEPNQVVSIHETEPGEEME